MRVGLMVTALLLAVGLAGTAAYAGNKGGGAGAGTNCCDAGTKPDQPKPTTPDRPGKPDNPATVTGGGGGSQGEGICTCTHGYQNMMKWARENNSPNLQTWRNAGGKPTVCSRYVYPWFRSVNPSWDGNLCHPTLYDP